MGDAAKRPRQGEPRTSDTQGEANPNATDDSRPSGQVSKRSMEASGSGLPEEQRQQVVKKRREEEDHSNDIGETPNVQRSGRHDPENLADAPVSSDGPTPDRHGQIHERDDEDQSENQRRVRARLEVPRGEDDVLEWQAYFESDGKDG